MNIFVNPVISDEQEVILLLGSNMGNRAELIKNAISAITLKCGKLIVQSSLYETAAWGNTLQPSFLNCAVTVQTQFSAENLLSAILEIEKKMGRTRNEKWEQRIIDIDILYYGNQIIDFPHLKIPHPYLHERKFALVPLCEIAPRFLHPLLKKTNAHLLELCKDELEVMNHHP